jgi:hypothetical protein
MTPKYLRIAEKNVEISLSIIKDENGTAFRTEAERQEHIVSFYENLYKNPAAMPNDFSNCVEDFLGELVDHPVIKSCLLDAETPGRANDARGAGRRPTQMQHAVRPRY